MRYALLRNNGKSLATSRRFRLPEGDLPPTAAAKDDAAFTRRGLERVADRLDAVWSICDQLVAEQQV